MLRDEECLLSLGLYLALLLLHASLCKNIREEQNTRQQTLGKKTKVTDAATPISILSVLLTLAKIVPI